MMYQWENSEQLAALRRDFSRCDDFGIFHHLPTALKCLVMECTLCTLSDWKVLLQFGEHFFSK
jgi:hypothetical protein